MDLFIIKRPIVTDPAFDDYNLFFLVFTYPIVGEFGSGIA